MFLAPMADHFSGDVTQISNIVYGLVLTFSSDPSTAFSSLNVLGTPSRSVEPPIIGFVECCISVKYRYCEPSSPGASSHTIEDDTKSISGRLCATLVRSFRSLTDDSLTVSPSLSRIFPALLPGLNLVLPSPKVQ